MRVKRHSNIESEGENRQHLLSIYIFLLTAAGRFNKVIIELSYRLWHLHNYLNVQVDFFGNNEMLETEKIYAYASRLARGVLNETNNFTYLWYAHKNA